MSAPLRRAKQGRISAKISHLVKEGVPQKQAVAESLSMERASRLGAGGIYRRVKKKKG